MSPALHGRSGPPLRGPDVLYRPLITKDALSETGGIRVENGGRRRSDVISRSMAGELAMDNGLFLSFAREVHLNDLETETTVIPCASIKLFLSGEIRASLNDQLLPMPVLNGGGWSPAGVVVSHTSRARFHRFAPRGSFLTKVVVDVPHHWIRARLTALPGLAPLILQDFGLWPWIPGPRACFLAAEILDLSQKRDSFAPLLMESCAMGLVWEALCAALPQSGHESDRPQIHAGDKRRFGRIDQYLALNPGRPVTPAEIATHLGTSLSTLQRSTHRLHGCSLAIYLRNKRLDIARDALLLGHATLSEIAYQAGYSSASNFSTAFRARHGASPSKLRSNR